mgnify:CR=1 FL=1
MTTYTNKLPELMQAYPRLFKNKEPRTSSWVDQERYELIDALCKKIDENLDENEIAIFEVLQIKEKFDELRFYFKASEKMRPLIKIWVEAAREASATPCEQSVLTAHSLCDNATS